jgi:hypothetical protein
MKERFLAALILFNKTRKAKKLVADSTGFGTCGASVHVADMEGTH